MLKRLSGTLPLPALAIGLPMVWLVLFFLLPFLLVIKIALASDVAAIPPYTPLLTFQDGVWTFRLDTTGFRFVFSDKLYLLAVLSSIRIAAIATAMTLLIGYPLAWGLANAREGIRRLGLFLVILPFWTSFLIRVYAWIGILKPTGYLNQLLLWLGVIDRPLQITDTDIAVIIGITYSYLPFMVLPIFIALLRVDPSLIEAAYDLGSRRWQAFKTVVLPLSMPGVIAGCTLVFIPALGEFVIPDLLGGAQTLMLGKVLWQEFFYNRDWPTASSVAIVMLLLLVVIFFTFRLMLKLKQRWHEQSFSG